MMTTGEHRYAMLYRPAGFATLPPRLQWSYAEAPHDIAFQRPDLPLSTYRHGVILTDRILTDAEVATYQLRPF